MDPKILVPDSEEYFKLQATCKIFEDLTEDMHFRVDETYFDAGQDWKWTTIIAYNDRDGGSWQALNPRDWNELLLCSSNVEIRGICKEIMSRYPSLWNSVEKIVVVNLENDKTKTCNLIWVQAKSKFNAYYGDLEFEGVDENGTLSTYSTLDVKYVAKSVDDAKFWIDLHKDKKGEELQ